MNGILLPLAAGLLVFTSCAHHRPAAPASREATELYVSGKAWLCSENRLTNAAAAGQTVRLVTPTAVLAEDVVGPDGSFVLHPRQEGEVVGPFFVEAEGRKLSLANDYASWLQDSLVYRAEVMFPCAEEAGSAAASSNTTGGGLIEAGAKTSGGTPRILAPGR